jgi:hypothetical protein
MSAILGYRKIKKILWSDPKKKSQTGNFVSTKGTPMQNTSNISLNRLKLAGLLSLVAASASATTPEPLVQCRSTTYDGAPVCAVEMTDYAAVDGTGVVQCPTGVSSTGRALLCEKSFTAAINDAALFFRDSGQPRGAYLIKIGPGSFDLSSETKAQPDSHGAIDVTGIAPTSAGCLTATAPINGTVALSGNPCLIISGVSPGETILTTANGIPAIFGKHISHVMFENMTMIQPNLSASQGTYVEQGTRTIQGVDHATLTLDMAPGLPTPLALYNLNCEANGRAGCSHGRLPTVQRDLYLRAYTNSAEPQLIQSTSEADSNAEVSWAFPGSAGMAKAAVPPTQPDPAEFPNRWTLTLSQPAGGHGIPSYYSSTTGGKPNLVCMKVNDAQAFWFDDIATGGTDVIMNNMKWIGAGRGSFRGISGQITGGGLGAQVYNSSIERAPPMGGQPLCLSTQSGGLQFGQPDDAPIYGNIVYGLKAVGTGDDSVAMFNDIGGTPGPKGVYYPQTVIAQSEIGNSFARDILLANNRRRSGLVGNSPVSVDAFTQGEITDKGHCDPIVLGTTNCPVTYVNN